MEKMKKTWISSAHTGYVLENMHQNTLSAFALAAKMGAELIETDVRTTKDGVLVANHNPEVKGYDKDGNEVEYIISETDSAVITKVILAPNDPCGVQYVPTLAQVLHLAYMTGMKVNIDLKEGLLHAEDVARLAVSMGMRGRVIYAPNGAGAEAIRRILKIDPQAQFIDTPEHFSRENLKDVPDYPAKCYAYTWVFTPEAIARIRESGCMLACISIEEGNAIEAIKWHPDMMEYPHTSNFAKIDEMILAEYEKGLI